jgi:UDP-3-O-[3-hydroxymyristoyl] glucosamine N-acyltransferase
VKLGDLAAQLGCELDGDHDLEVTRVAGIDEAGSGDLTFLANSRYAAKVATSRATAIIATADVSGARSAVLRTPNPYLTFARAIRLLYPTSPPPAGIHPSAVIAAEAILDEGVTIGPLVVIDAGARIGARTILHAHAVVGRDAVIGADCILHARVSIRERVQVGNRCVIQDGAVLGSDGFGFAHRDDGTHEKIPQIATVVIEDDVEIGANTTIDRPAVGETRIRSGTKIDNLVQIGHGVVVGRNALLAAQVGIAGSTVVGDAVMMGGQVGVAGHVTIGDRVKASGGTGIIGHVPADSFITGYPHMENLEWLKAHAIVRKLPELRKQLNALARRLVEIELKHGGEEPS